MRKMKKLKEANDSWGAMLPVNINKGSIPKMNLDALYSEEDMFRIYDISSPKTIELLGQVLQSSLIEYANPVAPLSALSYLKIALNRAGYDIDLSSDRIQALKSMESGYVDFPLFARTSPLYPYQIDQTYPGYRVEDDGIQSKLGYKLTIRIHVTPSVFADPSSNIEFSSKILDGEIIPQDD